MASSGVVYHCEGQTDRWTEEDKIENRQTDRREQHGGQTDEDKTEDRHTEEDKIEDRKIYSKPEEEKMRTDEQKDRRGQN